jgi:hypothetical protein
MGPITPTNQSPPTNSELVDDWIATETTKNVG